jgi:hypothetical protein
MRGALASIGDHDGRDITPMWVTKNTSTRIWLSSPGWPESGPPRSGSTIVLSLLSDEAAAAASAQGVGRFFMLPITEICANDLARGSLKNQGWCGEATVSFDGGDGTYSQNMQYKVVYPSSSASDAGFCPAVVLSEPIKPPVGLTNYLPPPGGSPPKTSCEAGGYGATLPQLTVSLTVPTKDEEAPVVRVPTAGWHGPAYSEDESVWDGGGQPSATDWGIRRILDISYPTFTTTELSDGITAAADSILDVYSQKPYLFEVDIASPWADALPDATAAATSTWAGLTKSITLSSTLRTTTFESSSFPVYSVWWDFRNDKTTLRCGTASGWVGGDFGQIVAAFTEAQAAKLQAKTLATLEDYRNQALNKPVDAVGGQDASPTDGCNTIVSDTNTRKVTDINQKAEIEQSVANSQALQSMVNESLFAGNDQTFPGAQIETPGLSDADAYQVVNGPVLQSRANSRIPFMGPTDELNADRSKYGGLIGMDNAEAGVPPDVFFVRGGYAFRGTPNAADTSGGRTGIQFSPIDANGQPTGAWTDFTSARDLPEGQAPLSLIEGSGSTQDTLLQRSRAVVKGLGRVEDELGNLLAPGDKSSGYPDGAPADLASMWRAIGMLASGLRPIPSSTRDPGGMVFSGPMNDNGADAGMLWRVMAPEMRLVEVEQVAAGSGTNGGNYDWKVNAAGALTAATFMGIIHKQIDGPSLANDGSAPLSSVPAASDCPLCFAGSEGRTLPTPVSTDYAAAGGILTMPPGVRGTPAFIATIKEDAYGPAAGPDGLIEATFFYSYQASAWSGATATAAGVAAISDGSNTGTGQYKKPGGSVPPGLRAIGLSAGFTGGGYPGSAVLQGLSVEVAVVQTVDFLAAEESLSMAEDVVTNRPFADEAVGFAEEVAIAVGVAESEGIEFGEYVWWEVS